MDVGDQDVDVGWGVVSFLLAVGGRGGCMLGAAWRLNVLLFLLRCIRLRLIRLLLFPYFSLPREDGMRLELYSAA